MQINELTHQIIGAAMAVHSTLGPGLLESAYQRCLVLELETRGLRVRSRVPIGLTYRGTEVDAVYFMDLLVEERVVVELKSVARIEPIHFTQLLTYVRLADKRIGLLINFNVRELRNGIQR